MPKRLSTSFKVIKADVSRYPAHMYALQLLLLEDGNVLGAEGSLQALTDVLVRLYIFRG